MKQVLLSEAGMGPEVEFGEGLELRQRNRAILEVARTQCSRYPYVDGKGLWLVTRE